MKVAVVEACNRTMDHIAALVKENHERYCRRWGYDHIADDDWGDTSRHPAWARWRLAMDSLADYDCVLMIDNDLLFMNHLRRLEPLLESVPDLGATYDVNGLNAGVVMLKNTPWTHKFLWKLWDAGLRYAAHASTDQTAMAYLLYAEPQERWACLRGPLPNRGFHPAFSFHRQRKALRTPATLQGPFLSGP